jgi:Tol biopolymer transport system component
MTLGEVGGLSGYVGLHVIDVATRTDHHVGAPAIAHPERTQPETVLSRLVYASIAHLGCPLPFQVTWSPDSKRLAYVCGDDLLRGGAPTRIYTIRADGSGRRRLPTGTTTAYWPSWSPDGKRIAFSTEPYPRLTYRCCSDDPVHHLRGTIYSVGVEGGSRVLVAKNAAAPGYSPDGRTIAFETMCGVRSTPVGAEPFVAPLCPRWTTMGTPNWSPDGSTLAVALRDGGVLLLTPDGRTVGSVSSGAPGAPAWAPTGAVARLLAPRGRPGY